MYEERQQNRAKEKDTVTTLTGIGQGLDKRKTDRPGCDGVGDGQESVGHDGQFSTDYGSGQLAITHLAYSCSHYRIAISSSHMRDTIGVQCVGQGRKRFIGSLGNIRANQ